MQTDASDANSYQTCSINETIVRMPNKKHKGIFLDTMLRKGTSYNSIKPAQSLLKKTSVLSQASLQKNIEQ